MSRSQRLLQLLQLLREHRFPVTGLKLAETLGISLRTLYRDIATLQAQGANIEGEAGIGYVLRPGFMLPPLMFSEEELEALVLGTRWVAERADTHLSTAAKQVIAKIASVLPNELQYALDTNTLLVGPSDLSVETVDVAQIRKAIRAERKLRIDYRDVDGGQTERIVWPFALGYFEQVRVVVAWCELRDGIRHFRTDRIASLAWLDQTYPRRRQVLLDEWRRARDARPRNAADRN